MSPNTSTTIVALPCAHGIDQLRRALRLHLREGLSSGGVAAFRGAARVMCEDARAQGIQIEELLIALKKTWAVVSEAEHVPRAENVRLLSRVVTLCVEEFYGPLG